MTRKNFLYLVLAVVGGLLFALGMCMCLLPEWNAFTAGVIVAVLGALVLLVLAVLRWIAAGKPLAQIDWKKTGKIAYCVLCLLVLGAGMAMIMAYEGLLVPGIIVGVLGMVLLLGLIPLFKGFKD